MTNKDKYLKDGVSVEEFLNILKVIIPNWYGDCTKVFNKFMKEQVKPTLTEDERAILRNFKECYKYIGREGTLYVGTHEKDSKFVSQVVIDEYKPNLFQFIKEEEEYEISELLKEDN